MSINYFKYGLASGDALTDRVIIWTKIAEPNSIEKLDISYQISEDPFFQNIIQQDETKVYDSNNYTIKIDVQELNPNTIYFYRFRYKDQYSPVGRTKTACTNLDTRIKFATVSCGHIQDGYLSAYYHLANQENLDFIVHLGDSIYEYGPNHRDSQNPFIPPCLNKYFRPIHQPNKDCVTLEDYRTRYQTYLLEPELQLINSLYCFYFVWDDHEIADNASIEGAENHNELTQGKWIDRLKAAKKAWIEYHPIREQGDVIYRSISYGDLFNLILLDERSFKNKQVNKKNLHERLSSSRTLIGQEQKEFLKKKLSESKVWQFIANPVMFSEFFIHFSFPKSKIFNGLRNLIGLTEDNNKIGTT